MENSCSFLREVSILQQFGSQVISLRRQIREKIINSRNRARISVRIFYVVDRIKYRYVSKASYVQGETLLCTACSVDLQPKICASVAF